MDEQKYIAFKNEIEKHSISELKLIYEDQKDLYSEEELDIIFRKINGISDDEHPQTVPGPKYEFVKCPKCDGLNPFPLQSNECVFCKFKGLDKVPPYDPNAEHDDEEVSIGECIKGGSIVGLISGLIILLQVSHSHDIGFLEWMNYIMDGRAFEICVLLIALIVPVMCGITVALSTHASILKMLLLPLVLGFIVTYTVIFVHGIASSLAAQDWVPTTAATLLIIGICSAPPITIIIFRQR